MKTLIISVIMIICCFFASPLASQTNFDKDTYVQFLETSRNLTGEELLSQYTPSYPYYKGTTVDTSFDQFCYLDSIILKYKLTPSELNLLKQNHFLVTERLSFNCFGQAFHDIYHNDLPVFITTDAILHALHASYDRILMDVEITILESKLSDILNRLYESYLQLVNRYSANNALHYGLGDVDLYVTTAKSLLENKRSPLQFEHRDKLDNIWNAILSEQLVNMPLFSERDRKLDFSQFTVRGHYTKDIWDPITGEKRNLGNYFKCMMWLGRMDFLLTPPPDNPWEKPWTRDETRRMNIGAVLLNELIDLAGVRSILNEIDYIIKMFVGESDNLTPEELSLIISDQNISQADDLLDDTVYDNFQTVLISSLNYGQRILSNFLLMDPYSSEPDTLPVSFRLMGQRFIIDSYVFSNLVYDRIIYQDEKVWRPMPDPLDAMFVLGNDNALPLLEDEISQYHYASQLASLRYLVDAYDDDFWSVSLYNVWLQAIRYLNPPADRTGFPFFMKTAAWQQEKLNTQLASWAQLRHDNLLYAKQSYTGGTACSFPHSFIEPYPDFYKQIADFAETAQEFFSKFPSENYMIQQIQDYFPQLKELMIKLQILAQKELNGQDFSAHEIDFLKTMLFIDGMSGAPPFSGWYADLFYLPDDAAEVDYIIADVHTQPTDRFGSVVGRVLHVGVGQINLGIFLADSPSDKYQPMAFVGPVMSYYEKITENFDRFTDERWKEEVEAGALPKRPDWTNIYLADNNGNPLPEGRELESVFYTDVEGPVHTLPPQFDLLQNYPNPFNPGTTISYSISQPSNVKHAILDIQGRLISTIVERYQEAGKHSINWNSRDLPSGVYFCRIQANDQIKTIKMMLIR
jgi:hypothetical protein